LWYLFMEHDIFLRVAYTDPSLFKPVGIVFGQPVDPEFFPWLFHGTMIVALCFTLGLWHRVTGPIFGIALLWTLCYQDSWSMIYPSMNLVALHGLVLGFTRSADALSIDSFFRGAGKSSGEGSERISWRYGWPIRLMCTLTVSTYFITAMAKLA